MAAKKTETNKIRIKEDHILNKIYIIRGHRVMLDSDLAELYGVETKRLNEQVKRNRARFPEHYVFELTTKEAESLRSQSATLNNRGSHRKYLPYAFTEHGVLMLANVLRSGRAVQMSIRIVDLFVKIRRTLLENTELRLIVEQLMNQTDNNKKNIELLFQYLDQLMAKKQGSVERVAIGYKITAKELRSQSRKLSGAPLKKGVTMVRRVRKRAAAI
jgi:phage regulator Rha-like protein